MSRLSIFSALLLGAGLVTGCAPDYTLELTTEDHGAIVQGEHISIPVGNAIGVTPLEDDDPLDEDVFVELVSSSPHIMEIEHTDEQSVFVLWGVSAGVADVEVTIDGELEAFIEVEVLPRSE